MFPKLGRIPLIFHLCPIMKCCNIVLPVTSQHIIIVIYYFIILLLAYSLDLQMTLDISMTITERK